MRCGDKLQHNYLQTVFRVIKEKSERLIVCSKCKDILSKQKPEKQSVAVPESEPKTVTKIKGQNEEQIGQSGVV